MDEFFTLPEENNAMVTQLLKELLKERVLVINDVVNSDLLEEITLQIIKINKMDKDIPKGKRSPIWIFIQSPGGSVMAGLNLIDVIESSETPVYTLCFSNCSSMAFHIFISGHKRFAFKNSILLNHDGEVSLSNSGAKAKDTMAFFNSLDERIKNHVISKTNITSEFYDSIYDKEYYMYANEEGKELGCVDYIIGEDVTINDIFK